jgi:putative transcriptional regulator
MKSKQAKRAKVIRKRTRDLFGEIMEGVRALGDEREGKMTLRTHPIEYREPPEISPKELVEIRENLRISRPVLAAYLRTNVRTLENWEQGRAKPNAQAALIIGMLRMYPDTVQRLASI